MANNDSHREPLALFAAHSPVRVVFGEHCVARVGELTRELGAHQALLVTDRGIVAAGHAERVRQSLAAAGIAVQCFDQVEENPGTACVQRCAEAARNAGIDVFIGLGGGSSMDTAKGANFLLTNGGRMQDYWGIGKALRPMLPLIAIPTTAGTGSECQSFALITDEITHQKMACGDPKAAARLAILDPCLTVSQPPRVTACAGIDAFAHALETAVTRKRTAVSIGFSHQAGRMVFTGFPEILRQPENVTARGQMLLGAALAGAAIEASMLGAAHATANPLTAHYGTAHGQAVGLMLPLVIRFNARDAETRQAYAEFAAAAGLVTWGGSPEVAVEILVGRLEWLLNTAGFPRSLAALGVRLDSVPELAAEATRQWTGSFNPRPVSQSDFIELYTAAFEERADGLAS